MSWVQKKEDDDKNDDKPFVSFININSKLYGEINIIYFYSFNNYHMIVLKIKYDLRLTVHTRMITRLLFLPNVSVGSTTLEILPLCFLQNVAK